MEPHEEDGGSTFVEVMALADAGLIPIVRSLLDESGIRYYILNDQIQNLFGFGQAGTGFNLITGPPRVMVEDDRADEARELLTPLEVPPAEDAGAEGEPPDE